MSFLPHPISRKIFNFKRKSHRNTAELSHLVSVSAWNVVCLVVQSTVRRIRQPLKLTDDVIIWLKAKLVNYGQSVCAQMSETGQIHIMCARMCTQYKLYKAYHPWKWVYVRVVRIANHRLIIYYCGLVLIIGLIT